MAKWYSCRRFLSWSLNGADWSVFYRNDGLDESELSLLVETLNKVSCRDDNEDWWAEIRLEPSLADEPARFLELQREWSRFSDGFSNLECGNRWERKAWELFNEACELATHLDGLRKAKCRTWYLRIRERVYPTADDYHVIAKIENLTDGEIEALETLLSAHASDSNYIPFGSAKWDVECLCEDDVVHDLVWYLRLQKKLSEAVEQWEFDNEPEYAWLENAAFRIIEDIEKARGKVIDKLAYEGGEDKPDGLATSPDASANGGERETAGDGLDDGPEAGVVDQSHGNGEAESPLAASANGVVKLRDVDADKVERALQFIRKNPGAVQRTVAVHIDVKYVTFRRHYRDVLESHGVVSGPRGRGLYVDEAAKIEQLAECSATQLAQSTNSVAPK